jgi:hypothetical protein
MTWVGVTSVLLAVNQQAVDARRGTGSASVGFLFDVDSLRLQLAGCQRASCRINSTVHQRATLLTTRLHWQSQCHKDNRKNQTHVSSLHQIRIANFVETAAFTLRVALARLGLLRVGGPVGTRFPRLSVASQLRRHQWGHNLDGLA